MARFDNVKFINRLAYLIGGLAVFVLIFSFINYGVNNWFLVNKVTITGNMEHVDEGELTYIAQKRVQGNLFTLDINDIQNDFRRIPWVKHVTVYREFPNSITIGVSEYSAVARIGDDGLISADGQIFTGNVDSQKLPLFSAPEQNISEALADYKLINRMLAPRKVEITKLSINGLGITKLELSNNLRIVICGASIESQMQVMNQYWDKLYDVNPGLNYVNMCYKNALAINAINKPAASGVVSIRKSASGVISVRKTGSGVISVHRTGTSSQSSQKTVAPIANAEQNQEEVK